MRPARQITVTDRQRAQLEKWSENKAKSPYRLIERCRIIIMSADGVRNKEQGRILGVNPQRVRRWRKRWAESSDLLVEAEGKEASNKDFAMLLLSVLNDKSGRGRKPSFTAEQVSRLIGLACESPEDSGRPVTHWTPKELAAEAIERGIFETISPRHADRLLKGGRSDLTNVSTG